MDPLALCHFTLSIPNKELVPISPDSLEVQLFGHIVSHNRIVAAYKPNII